MNVSSAPTLPLGRTLLAACRSMLIDLFRPYHPERHYMRGPGPKWRQKNMVNHLVLRPDRLGPRPRLARVRIRI
ncbi:hypothetical protein [Rhodoplanes roseus]|uniref:Uncharacterized protein n=1 Tax=Rhodoplanes roseus TaxID=29409 RepID=A0A327L113_9BRAD|nr:hypothetical protein [Rhodoplanes roseus]RAI44649.1 hypothetical protein CH341_08140 [Rhodoplanes roseus]